MKWLATNVFIYPAPSVVIDFLTLTGSPPGRGGVPSVLIAHLRTSQVRENTLFYIAHVKTH